jgi:two-component system sensor histidine kinase VicK
VLAHVGDGVFQLDLDERVTLWNRGAEFITGIDEADALGRPIGELLERWEEVRERIEITETPIAVGRRDALSVRIGGRDVWLVISGVTSGDGIVYAFRDVTQSEQLELARRDFLATVSHELRTPLAGVFGATKTLLHRELDDELRRRMLEVIDSQSERLAQILDELLSAASLDAGGVELVTEACDVVPLVEEAVALERARAPEGIVLAFDAPPNPPLTRCEPEKLRQVLLNLLDNAVKYSPDGGTITVSLTWSADTVRLSVADEGLGIPASARDLVFEKFFRLDPHLSRGVGGTGLGLYLSREFVKRMGGRIWIESSEPRGTVVHVELPTAGPDDAAGPAAASG